MVKKLIIENANWLKTYDSSRELENLSMLPVVQRLQCKKEIKIADIGCGNGRSLQLLRTLFPHAHITAIDRIEENIQYAMRYIHFKDIDYIVCNAVEYFSVNHDKLFDLAFFSWSFFDMINESNQSEKEKMLKGFLDDIVSHLDNDGAIVVLQPTKGGSFEKLLSLFMPSSDEIYAFTHNFLKSYGFTGPATFIPLHNDPLGIWSEFKYQNDDELFNGIASVLSLEMDEVLTREKYHEIIDMFRRENKILENELVTLSDCVNIYYLYKGVGRV